MGHRTREAVPDIVAGTREGADCSRENSSALFLCSRAPPHLSRSVVRKRGALSPQTSSAPLVYFPA